MILNVFEYFNFNSISWKWTVNASQNVPKYTKTEIIFKMIFCVFSKLMKIYKNFFIFVFEGSDNFLFQNINN
jgi:hypothetical protein